MGHVDEVNPPDLAAQPSMISLKCQIPRFGRNPDAVSAVFQSASTRFTFTSTAAVHFPSRSKAWMDVSASDRLTNVPLLTKPRRFVSNLHPWFGKSLCLDLFFLQSISSARRSSSGVSQDEGTLRCSTPHICDKESMLNHRYTQKTRWSNYGHCWFSFSLSCWYCLFLS